MWKSLGCQNTATISSEDAQDDGREREGEVQLGESGPTWSPPWVQRDEELEIDFEELAKRSRRAMEAKG